jgi:hypothetical protein
MSAFASAQLQESVRKDAALEELVLDELRQVGTSRVFGLGEEGGRGVLLYQAIQRGLFCLRRSQYRPPMYALQAQGSGPDPGGCDSTRRTG